MAKYQVEVVETLSRVIEVEADSYEEAENKVARRYDNEEIVLDWHDLESTSYKEYPSPKLKEEYVDEMKR